MIPTRPLDRTDVTLGTATQAADGTLAVQAGPGALAIITVSHLPATATAVLTLTASATPATYNATPTLMIAGRIYPLSETPTALTVEAPADGLDLRASSIQALTIHTSTISITGDPLAATPLPYGHLCVEARVPRPGTAFRLDFSRLNRSRLDYEQVIDNAIVLNRSRLDYSRLYDVEDLTYWRPLLPKATHVTIRRGGGYDGLLFTPEVGTLTIDLLNDADPRVTGVIYGCPIRAFNPKLREPIFTGTVTNANLIPLKPAGYRVQIVAADTIHELSQVMRYGCVDRSVYSFRNRVADLLDPHQIPWKQVSAYPSNGTLLAPTVYESNLTSHLDLAAATVRGTWWTEKTGTIIICAGKPSTASPVAFFTDSHLSFGNGEKWPYIEVEGGFGFDDLVTSIEVTEKRAVKDQENKWADEEITLPAIDNPTYAKAYGRRKASITVNANTEEAAAALGAAYVSAVNPGTVARRVTLDATALPERASRLEIMQPVTTALRGEPGKAFITEITHNITPLKWQTTLNLMEA